MAKVSIKNISPFSERKVKPKGYKTNLLIGVKSYPRSELKNIQKEMKNIISDNELEIMQATLKDISNNMDKTDIAYYDKKEALEQEIEERLENLSNKLEAFYRSHILYLKNAEITVEDKDIVIADTRNIEKPLESLGDLIWSDSKQCLAVLLDMYFEISAFKDSIIAEVYQALFNIDYDDLKGKN